MLSILINKKGISLIEILVGSIMFAIVFLTVFSALAPMMMAYYRANDFAEYNTLLDSVGNRIVAEMTNASEITDLDPLTMTTHSGKVIISVDLDGLLLKNNAPVFPRGFYKGKSIDFEIQDEGDEVYAVIVTVMPNTGGGAGATGAEISREYALRLWMLS